MLEVGSKRHVKCWDKLVVGRFVDGLNRLNHWKTVFGSSQTITRLPTGKLSKFIASWLLQEVFVLKKFERQLGISITEAEVSEGKMYEKGMSTAESGDHSLT